MINSLLDISTNLSCTCFSAEDIYGNIDWLGAELAEVNTRAFALKDGTSIEEMKHRLSCTSLLILLHEELSIKAFAMFQEIAWDSGPIIYQSRGIVPDYRTIGLGRRMSLFGAKALGASYLVAKAQNPISIWSTIRSGLFKEVFPFDREYSRSLEMTRVLHRVLEVRGKLDRVDLNTGLERGSYPMGKLGDYTISLTHDGVSDIYQKLCSFGLEPQNGDAIFYGGRVQY